LPSRADVQGLIDIGATVARYQIYYDWNAVKFATCDQYTANTRHYTNYLQTLLDLNIKWVVDLHVPFGGRENSQDIVFLDKVKQDCMANVWLEIASKFKNNDKIFAYDLYNEPLGAHRDISDFMHRLRSVVRSIDTDKIVIVAPYQHSAKYFGKLKVYPKDLKTWYSFHFYDPGSFTHYGGSTPSNKAARYPQNGQSQSERIARLESTFLTEVITFQRKNPKAKIYLGEFGSSIYTDKASRFRWYNDVSKIANARFDAWTFHAWREWEGWSIENQPKLVRLVSNRLRE
jgi:hypothetical protein